MASEPLFPGTRCRSSAVTKAMSPLSGRHANCSTPLGASVICSVSPPLIERTKICAFSSFPGPTEARKAMRSPVGDQRGERTSLRSWVKARRAAVAISCRTRSRSLRSCSIFIRDTTYTIDFPSGEICGSETATTLAKSASSIRRACAFAPCSNTTQEANRTQVRRIRPANAPAIWCGRVL